MTDTSVAFSPDGPTVPFAPAEYRLRLARLARQLRREKLEAMLVLSDANRFYLTGFTASNGVLLVTPAGRPRFYTDFRYLEAADSQLPFVRVEKIGKPADQLAPIARRGGWARVGYEGSLLPASRLQAFRDALPSVKEWVNADGTVSTLRMIKSRCEMRLVRAAVRAADAAFARFLPEVRPGMSEWELRRRLRRHIDDVAQGESFDCILAVGENASRCHHHPGARILGRSEQLLVDMGVIVQGYCSDMTRTVYFGRPPRRFRHIYEVVLEANRKAIRGIRPGRTGREIDAIARGHIERHGYGRYFDHGLGHGVGLAIHERPSFSKTEETVLRPGMVMTVEPGVYIPGYGGVRIEDMIVVTRAGCEVLTRTPKDLQCLPL